MISVIVPVYNTEAYLDNCLKSIYNQTYKDIQLIVINDGSTDNSNIIINEYKKIFNNMVYIEQKNSGQSTARNLALQYVEGEYIFFVDSDDYLDINTFEVVNNNAKLYEADMIIIGYEKVFENNSYNQIFKYDHLNKGLYSGREILDELLKVNINGILCNKIFKTKIFLQNKIFFEPGRYIEDWFPIFKYSISSEKIVVINKPLYKYRQINSSSIHKSNLKVLDDYSYAITNIIEYVENSNIEYYEESLLIFKCKAFDDLIHEFYKIKNKNKNKNKLYKLYKDYGYYYLYIDTFRILRCKNIKLKNKISIISWKIKVYHLLKKIYNLKQE